MQDCHFVSCLITYITLTIMRFRNDKRLRCFSQSNQSFVVYRLPFVSMRFSNETNGTNGPVIPWVNMFQEPFRLLIEQVC